MNSEFGSGLGPLLRMGPGHPAVVAVRDGLQAEWACLSEEAVALGNKDREWWSGAAAAVKTLLDQFDAELLRVVKEQEKEG